MKFSTSSAPAWLMAAAAALSLSAQAQTLLRGKDLSEKNLIEALSPPAATAPAAEAEEEAPRTRSIRVMRDQPSARTVEQSAPAAPAKKTSASVLITFVTNSAELTDRARAALDVVGRALKADRLASFRFAIEGHADPRGDSEANLRLSQSRADSVVNYLTTQHEINRDRLKPIGKGDSELLNTRQIDAPENRRVTIVTLRE
jgi:outer membrane protein OmpA-like peptidoglycan-associated protein